MKLTITILTILAVSGLAETPSGRVVARVIFSEAGPQCDPTERFLVASVIKNRIRHPGFGRGRLISMRDVVTQKGAFEALNHTINSNWRRSANPEVFSGSELTAWWQSNLLAENNFTPLDDIVYYHDKSIVMPKSWSNRYYTAYRVIETKHFIFYGVRAK